MSIPTQMTEIFIKEFGHPSVLTPRQVAVPAPSSNEVLVRVQAAGVNRPDVLQRMGKYPLPPDANPTPGLEIAGEVVAMGSSVTKFAIGDRVCALTNGGGYAQYCVVPEGQCLDWPSGYTAIQAAAITETYFTVWANLFQIGKVQHNETVLVHGGTSGIGIAAIQLAKIFGVRVIATAGSTSKCTAIDALGATSVNYHEQDFVSVVKAATGGKGVDVVLDIVGADYFERNIACLAKDGRLLLVGFLGGSVVENFDLGRIMSKRITVTGSAMRPRTLPEKSAIASELEKSVWPHLGQGAIEPIIHAVFPLEQAAAAHALMESSEHIGKIVLTCD